MEKSSFSSSRRITPPSSSSSIQEQKTESSQNNKPAQRAPLGNLIERQANVTEKRGRYLSQKPTRFTNADALRKGKGNPLWAPVSPSIQAKQQVATNQSPHTLRSPPPRNLGNLVELEADSYASNNDSSAEVPTTAARPEKANEESHLLEKEGSLSITPSDHKAKKLKLPKLPGRPRFGDLISPRAKKSTSEKTPTIPLRSKAKSSKMYRPEQLLSDPLSQNDDGLFSPHDIAATIILPDANAEHFTPEDLVSVLDNLFSNPNEKGKNIDLRVMNILYCATGAASALEKSDSYPEIGAYAEFLSKGQNDPVYATMYMNALFTALMPHLDKKLRRELEDAYFENRDGMLALQKCLAQHLAKG